MVINSTIKLCGVGC